MPHDLRQTAAWQALDLLAPAFDETPRISRAAGLTLDLTTAGYDGAVQQQLFALAEELNWSSARDDLLSGAHVNTSENQAALHTAMRAAGDKIPPAVKGDVLAARAAIQTCLAKVQAIGALDIIHVGLGGSGLAPLFLRSFFQGAQGVSGSNYRLHIIVNADPVTLRRIQQQCDPRKTIVVIASKTFTTDETMLVANQLKTWLGDLRRMFAVTLQAPLAEKFGVPKDHIIPLPEWLGGRFSLWGGVAFPILLTFGPQQFEQLQQGARKMDEHFASAPAEESLPLLLALAHIWQQNFMGCRTRVIIPYADALRHLPAYLQQLEMESNGKACVVPTAPAIFGGVGSTVQHSFMQWMHQGSDLAATDFVVADRLPGEAALSEVLRRNALAQSAALAHGAPPEFPGGRPSNMVFLPELSPAALGALLALYEHKVYLEAHIWGINCFDQPGVELGKKLARQISTGDIPRSTGARLARYK